MKPWHWTWIVALACSGKTPPGPSADSSPGETGEPSAGDSAESPAGDSADDSADLCAGAAALLGGQPYPTVQAAIDVAVAGDVVELCPGTFAENLLVPAALAGALELRGRGVGETVIDGGGRGPVLEVGEGLRLGLVGLTLRGGAGRALDGVLSGGGLLCLRAAITLEDVEISANTAQAGGGMYLQGCEVEGLDAALRDNLATDGAGAYVARDDEVPSLLRGLRFEANEAEAAGGGVYMVGRGSGAIDLRVESCVFEANRGYDGAGIYEGSRNGTFEVLDSEFIENDGKQGGALFLASGGTLSDVLLSGNNTEKEGGALWLGEGSLTSVERVVFASNTATGGAGLWAEGEFSFEAVDTDFSTAPYDNMPEDIGSSTLSLNYGDGVDLSCDASGCTGG